MRHLDRLIEAIRMDDAGDNRSEVLAALQDLQTWVERGGDVSLLVEREAPVAPPLPRKWEVVGQVFYAGGFCLTVEAPTREAAERKAESIVERAENPATEYGLELNEVCINSAIEEDLP